MAKTSRVWFSTRVEWSSVDHLFSRENVVVLDAVVAVNREKELEGTLVVRIRDGEGTSKVNVELLSEVRRRNASVGGSNVADQSNEGGHHFLVPRSLVGGGVRVGNAIGNLLALSVQGWKGALPLAKLGQNGVQFNHDWGKVRLEGRNLVAHTPDESLRRAKVIDGARVGCSHTVDGSVHLLEALCGAILATS